jgi:CHAD domain
MDGTAHPAPHGACTIRSRFASSRAPWVPQFGLLYDAGRAASLNDELRWVSGELGRARDSEVMRDRMNALIGGEPEDPGLQRLAARVDEELAAAERAGEHQPRQWGTGIATVYRGVAGETTRC